MIRIDAGATPVLAPLVEPGVDPANQGWLVVIPDDFVPWISKPYTIIEPGLCTCHLKLNPILEHSFINPDTKLSENHIQIKNFGL